MELGLGLGRALTLTMKSRVWSRPVTRSAVPSSSRGVFPAAAWLGVELAVRIKG